MKNFWHTLTSLFSVPTLHERIADLEEENERLKQRIAHVIANPGPSFESVSREFPLAEGFTEELFDRVYEEYAPIIAPHMLQALSEIAQRSATDIRCPSVAIAQHAMTGVYRVRVEYPKAGFFLEVYP